MATEEIRYIYNSDSSEKSMLIKNKANYCKTIVRRPKVTQDVLCHAINHTNSVDTLDTSYRKKNNVRDETQDVISYDSARTTSKANQGGDCRVKMYTKMYTKLSIGRMEYQLLKTYECNANNLNNNNVKTAAHTFFSKKDFTNENSYNNITFKEINSKDKSDNSIINENYFTSFKKDKSYSLLTENTYDMQNQQSQKKQQKQQNQQNQQKNLEIIVNLKKNILKQFKTENLLDSIKNNIDKIEKKIFNKSIYKNAIIKNILNSDIQRNKNNLKEINNKMKFDKIKNKYLYKFKKPDEKNLINDNKKSLLNLHYKNHTLIPKINTKLVMKNIQLLKLKKSYKKICNENTINKITKIQSVWRGIHIRKIYIYFWHINKFVYIINYVIVVYNKKYFFKLLFKEYNNNKNRPGLIKYSEYLNHFNSNLNIMNNDEFIITKKPLSKNIYKITNNNSLFLIHKRNIVKQICHNESLNITENTNKKNYSPSKTNRTNKYFLEEETQINLTTEIKAKQRIPIFKNIIIEQQNSNINIINKNKTKNNNINEKINRETFTLLSEKKDYKCIRIFGEKKDFNDNDIKKDKKNYNNNNYEMDIRESLEINPIEIKRSKNNIKNIFINNTDKFEFLNDKESIMTEKAKINLMKIILPIKLKKILGDWIKQTFLHLLIKKLKYIAFISHLMIVSENYKNNSKRYVIGKIKRIYFLYYKNFYLNHIAKIKMHKLLNDYSIFIWNKSLKDFAIFFINNK